jgi:hypothetical protein
MIPILLALWKANYCVYGRRKLWKAAQRAGHDIGRDRLARLMRAAGIAGTTKVARRFSTHADPTHPRAPDLVKRNFVASRPDALWVADFERHEALLNPAVMKGHRRALVAASASKLRAARPGGRRGGWTAALTTTGRISTARWSGSGKRNGKAYVRNQRLNAPQETQRLEPGGSGPQSSAHLHGYVQGTPRPGEVAGQEATVKACGVAVAMLQGHSWAPTPLKGSRVNVGTVPTVPSPAGSPLVGGKTRRRSMPSGWDGGPVVVRGRESRSHGEGAQRVRSINAERGARR